MRSVSRFPFHSSLRLTTRLAVRQEHAPQGHALRQVEKHDGVGPLDHGRPDLAVVVAVDDPALGRRRERSVDTRLEHVGRRLLPARVVVERIELDMWDAEPARKLARDVSSCRCTTRR